MWRTRRSRSNSLLLLASLIVLWLVAKLSQEWADRSKCYVYHSCKYHVSGLCMFFYYQQSISIQRGKSVARSVFKLSDILRAKDELFPLLVFIFTSLCKVNFAANLRRPSLNFLPICLAVSYLEIVFYSASLIQHAIILLIPNWLSMSQSFLFNDESKYSLATKTLRRNM